MSPGFKTQLKKLAIGAVIAGVGAACTSAIEGLAKVDFGVYTPYVTAGLAVAANGVRKIGQWLYEKYAK